MPREKGVTQLELLRRKQAEISQQLKAAEARDQDKKKRLDDRRKELLGGIVLEHAIDQPDNPWTQTLFEIVGRKLTRPADRALFPNLPVTEPASISSNVTSKSMPEPAEASD